MWNKYKDLMESRGVSHIRFLGAIGLMVGFFFMGSFLLRAEGEDTAGPLISNIAVTNVTEDAATVTWSTDEDGYGWLEFTPPCPPAGCVTPMEAVATRTHTANLTGLLPSTNYNFEVKTQDLVGNVASSMKFATQDDEVLPPPPPPPLPSGDRPNIVVILTDDQRWDMFGPDVMPITNQLIGDQGVRFSNSFITTPLCCPARASLLTGLYTHNHNTISVQDGATLFQNNGWEESNLGVWLQNAGYRTGLYGKYLNQYHLVVPFPYVPKGWSEWHAFETPDYKNYHLIEKSGDGPITRLSYGRQYSTPVLAEKSVNFIETTPADQELFLYFNPYGPHNPYMAETPEDTAKFPLTSSWRAPSFNEADVSDKPGWVKNINPLTTTKADYIDTVYRSQKAALQSVDRGIGEIIAALQRTGRLDNTVIVFLSDNGFMLGEHRIAETKDCGYEECVKTGLMIRAPGISPRTEPKFVINLDVTSTVLDYANVAPGHELDGVSLRPLLHDPNISPWRQDVFLETLNPGHPFSAVRTNDYKYIITNNTFKELYDLINDPYEMQNLASNPAYASVLSDLQARVNVYKSQ